MEITCRNDVFKRLSRAVHEMLGIGILLSVWGACYRLNPTRRMMSLALFRRIVSSPRMKNFGEAYDRGANAWNRRFSTFSFARYVNPQRAAESLGESFVVRKFSSPLLVPMKIWLAFKLTA